MTIVADSFFAEPAVGMPSIACSTVFERMESNVRTYSRAFPAVFERAKDAYLYDENGRTYIDFFAGAGALNYGHNPDFIKPCLIQHLTQDRIVHGLDLFTTERRRLLESFERIILAPRGLDYKVQFCGPTGANTVEAAMKLARLATKRVNVASFSGGWHGMSNACLSVTGNKAHRAAAGTPLNNSVTFPFEVGPRKFLGSLEYIESLFEDPNSGLDTPAAIILETVQAEGGVYVASPEWLRGVRALCDRWGVLMIVDDIQAGCGRTGTFFSFEEAGIEPDLVCLSKSIGGYGLPMSLLLIRRDLDIWEPGQHTGTFRGNQLAMVAATAAIELWGDPTFLKRLDAGVAVLSEELAKITAAMPDVSTRGRGFLRGLDFSKVGGRATASEISRHAFEHGLIVETCGRNDNAIKLLPPIITEPSVLQAGCKILHDAIHVVLMKQAKPAKPGARPNALDLAV